MSDKVILAEDVSKLYRLGTVGGATLKEDIGFAFRKLLGKNNISEIGEINNREASGNSDYVWALKDINFDVNQGEVIGIIGRNGAGKSTLLKILSKVTSPTTGSIKVRGRIASLLEVGTGFHPELTGKENIFLNGAILGMSKKEIKSKLDEIVDFAGVERYINTPVKRYSSGMYVRLAFAVAAHLEPEILIVDEVLAVGDVEFQKKCLGKMKDVSQHGRTILFVSHNMASIKNLCTRGIFMEQGTIKQIGDINSIVNSYLNRNLNDESNGVIERDSIVPLQEGLIKTPPTFTINQVKLVNSKNEVTNKFYSTEDINVVINMSALERIMDLRVVVEVVDEFGTSMLASQISDDETYLSYLEENKIEKGEYEFTCKLPKNTFSNQQYYLTLQVINVKNEHVNLVKFMHFEVIFLGYNNIQYGKLEHSYFRPKLEWSFNK